MFTAEILAVFNKRNVLLQSANGSFLKMSAPKSASTANAIVLIRVEKTLVYQLFFTESCKDQWVWIIIIIKEKHFLKLYFGLLDNLKYQRNLITKMNRGET